jgi:hypothetical protein
LAKPWTFTVHNEYRNESLVKWLGKWVEQPGWGGHPLGEVKRPDGGRDWEASQKITTPCTLPKGSQLRVDRIYIRKGVSDYNSVTFFLIGAANPPEVHNRVAIQVMGPGERRELPYTVKKPKKPVRFWAKLDDVNTMKIT